MTFNIRKPYVSYISLSMIGSGKGGQALFISIKTIKLCHLSDFLCTIKMLTIHVRYLISQMKPTSFNFVASFEAVDFVSSHTLCFLLATSLNPCIIEK